MFCEIILKRKEKKEKNVKNNGETMNKVDRQFDILLQKTL